MKKLIANHKTTQKIFLSIIIVLLLSFAVPAKSQAGFGGLLLDPIFDFVGTIVDVAVGALQAFLVDGEFNNSKEGSGLNFYLADADEFMKEAKEGGAYEEFAYHTGSGEAEVTVKKDDLDNFFGISTYAIPVMRYTPEKIFSGRVPALDINFVNPKDWGSDEMNERSITRQIHETIATWYVSLRNLAVVGLMLVLVYVGIRIVISSTSSDKAKYKQMLMDWLVALCILFCLHYIMTFTTAIVSQVTQSIAGAEENNGNNIAVTVEGDNKQFNTDLMGLIRFKMQAPDVAGKILYLILYIAMVIYTCMFTFYYLRRVLTMAFLTLISPLVALTYPIDKLRDGKAQAFDMWLKEYTFNALLQPFHLIIYSIFVSSAIDLAAKNPLIAIVTLAFITPAEKILRKFFGFEKASTAGALGAAASVAGGAALMGHMKNLMAPKRGGAGNGGNKGVRQKQRVEGDVPSLSESLGGQSSGGEGNQENPTENQFDGQFGNIHINAQGNKLEGDSSIIGRINSGSSEEGLPAVTSTSGMSMQNGLWVPDNVNSQAQEPNASEEDNNTQDIPFGDTSRMRMQDGRLVPDIVNRSAQVPDTSSHGQGAFKWSDNDTRGAGEYLGGIAKVGASWAGDKAKGVGSAIANSAPGQGAIRLGRTVGNWGKGVRDFAVDKANKVGDATIGKIPKPIRNSAGTLARKAGAAAISGAKGVGNVALQTGLAAGKATLKAAPGAILGMAAGIAGDELSDIPKYATMGAALSSTVGSSAVAQAGNFISDAYREGAQGKTPEAIIQRQQQEYVKSKEWDDVYQQEFKHEDGSKLSRAELKAKKQQGAFYDSRGIQGEDAIKAVKLEEKIKQEVGQDQEDFSAQDYTARIMKIAKSYSADKLRDEGKVQGLTTSIEKELMRGGLDQRSAQSQAKTAVKFIKQAKGVKD